MGVWAPAFTIYWVYWALRLWPRLILVVPFPSNDDLLMSLPSFITSFLVDMTKFNS